jgi:hypothetical protein
MTDQEINEAIALACGWIYYDGWHHPDGRSGLPNYCTDLNAMHEAEKTLTDEQWDKYCDLLGGSLYYCTHATARVKAGQFTRTIGKWKEESK